MYHRTTQRAGGTEPGPEGYITFGMNPVGIEPNSSKMINALSKLKWMVVGENYEIETATFWTTPKQYGGSAPSQTPSGVLQPPSLGFAEKGGSFIHSASLVTLKSEAVLAPVPA